VVAAMGAAVAHILERPDSIRQRAQTAAAIASPVIAALVIAAITGLLREETEACNTLTIALVVIATVAWVISVVFFVYVVAFARGKPGYPTLLTASEKYANTLRKRLRIAAVSSTVARFLAVVAVGVERLGTANFATP